jgi:hypothetical protein
VDRAILNGVSEASGYAVEELTRLGPRILLDLIRHRGLERLVEIEDDPEASLLDFLKTLTPPPDDQTAPAADQQVEVEVTLKYDHSRNGIRYGPGRCVVPQAIAADLELDDRRRERATRKSPVLQDRGE